MKANKIIAGFFAIVIILSAGCKKEDNSLQLPPAASMDMNFDFASSQKSATVNTQSTYVYHTAAAVAVLYWSGVAYVYTAIPAASFKKAFEYSPSYDANTKVWTWEYNVNVASDSYYAQLTGKVVEDSVEWQMHISKVGDNNIQNFLWYYGKSNVNRQGGWWVLKYQWDNHGVLVPDEGLFIDWAYKGSNDFHLRYTYVANKSFVYDESSQEWIWVDNTNIGGYIEYGHKDDPEFNAWYNIYSQEETKLYQIKWNTSTKTGTIITPTDQGCWDKDLADADCAN